MMRCTCSRSFRRTARPGLATGTSVPSHREEPTSDPKYRWTSSINRVVRTIPRRADHEAISPVAGLKELQQIAATKGLDPFLRPENGKSEGVVPPEHLLEEIMDVVVGGVFDHPDLLEDHRPLPADLRLVEARPGEDIGQKIDGQLQVVIRDLDVEGGEFLPGGGVHDAADGIDGGGDIEGGPPLGSLEQHVLNEMGRAVGQAGFMAGTAFHPGADGDRPDMVDLLGDQADAVV